MLRHSGGWFLTKMAYPPHYCVRAPAVLFNEYRRVDAPKITPALLPYTMALMEASRLPRPFAGCSITARSIIALLDRLYSRPDRLAARVLQLPPGLIQSINHTYNVMDAMATDFATCALQRISSSGSAMPKSLLLSPAEHFRFRRAFYRVELYYILFGGGSFDVEWIGRWFFSRHPPWENEQLGCVAQYLGTRLDQVLAEPYTDDDIEVDEDEISLSPCWLSRGVQFIYELANAPSPKAKRSMLNAGINASFTEVRPMELDDTLEMYGRSDDEHLSEKCESVTLHHYGQPNEDADSGPYQAWFADNGSLGESVGYSLWFNNDWLRERAHVFWDSDRLQEMGSLRERAEYSGEERRAEEIRDEATAMRSAVQTAMTS